MFKPFVNAWVLGFIVLWAGWLGVPREAKAMLIQRMDSDVFVSGDIVVNDDLRLRAEFESAPVKRLILVNSRGGHLSASLAMARWLTTQSITTLAVGPCLSACSLIFMAGASALMVGNYLTTLNQPVEKDLQMLQSLTKFIQK